MKLKLTIRVDTTDYISVRNAIIKLQKICRILNNYWKNIEVEK